MSEVKKKWTFKRVLQELLTTLLLFFIISQLLNFIRKPDIQTDIYTYALKDIDNKVVAFSQYKKRPLVVVFWGTWCPICKLEAPNLEKLSKQYNLLSIAVNSDTDEKIKAYMAEHQLSYRVINDANGILAKKFNIAAYPTTLIYNAKGELKFTEVGYSTTLGLQARIELIQ